MFSILYDNNWTEAYEQLEKEKDDKHICAYLLDLFKVPCIYAPVEVVIVWYLALQLPMQSVPITTHVVSSKLDEGKVYNLMW
jgi:hypothetical protein